MTRYYGTLVAALALVLALVVSRRLRLDVRSRG